MASQLEILVHVSATCSLEDDTRHRGQAIGFLQTFANHQYGHFANNLQENLAVSLNLEQDLQGLNKSAAISPERTNGSVASGIIAAVNDSRTATILSQLSKLDKLAPVAHLTPSIVFSENVPLQTLPHQNPVAFPLVQVVRTPVVADKNASVKKSSSPCVVSVTETPLAALRPENPIDSWETPPSTVQDSPSQSQFPSHSYPTESPSKRPAESEIYKMESKLHISPPSCKRSRLDGLEEPLNPVVTSGLIDTYEAHDTVLPLAVNDLSKVLHSPISSLIPDSSRSFTFTALPAPCSVSPVSRPRLPVTSASIEFTTHVTASLKAMSCQLPLTTHFLPKFLLRPVNPLERGYWRLDVPCSWNTTLWAKFWRFLSNLVEGGHAGWGTWVESLASGDESLSLKDYSTIEGKKPEIDSRNIRIWCWGEVVGHIWLVLFLASDRKIKGLAAAWIDGSGKEVVLMD